MRKTDPVRTVLFILLMGFHLFFWAGEILFAFYFLKLGSLSDLAQYADMKIWQYCFPSRVVLSYLDNYLYGMIPVMWESVGMLRWIYLVFLNLFGVISAKQGNTGVFERLVRIAVLSFAMGILTVIAAAMTSATLSVDTAMIYLRGLGLLYAAVLVYLGYCLYMAIRAYTAK